MSGGENKSPFFYTKKDLIAAYTGGMVSYRTGSRWLEREINSYPGVREELERLGYSSQNRTVTRAQLMVIYGAIGAP